MNFFDSNLYYTDLLKIEGLGFKSGIFQFANNSVILFLLLLHHYRHTMGDGDNNAGSDDDEEDDDTNIRNCKW